MSLTVKELSFNYPKKNFNRLHYPLCSLWATRVARITWYPNGSSRHRTTIISTEGRGLRPLCSMSSWWLSSSFRVSSTPSSRLTMSVFRWRDRKYPSIPCFKEVDPELLGYNSGSYSIYPLYSHVSYYPVHKKEPGCFPCPPRFGNDVFGGNQDVHSLTKFHSWFWTKCLWIRLW